MRPHVLIDHLLALIDQGLAHAQQLLASHLVGTIVNVAWLILNACQLEQVHYVSICTVNLQAILVKRKRTGLNRSLLRIAVDAERVEGALHIDLLIRRPEVAEEVARAACARIRANPSIFRCHGALDLPSLRLEVGGDTCVFTQVLED